MNDPTPRAPYEPPAPTSLEEAYRHLEVASALGEHPAPSPPAVYPARGVLRREPGSARWARRRRQ